VANLDAVQLGQVRPDVADAHPAPVHRDDLVVEAVEATLVLAHDLRLEAALAVARLLDPHAPVPGVDRLRRRTVSRIARPAGRSLSMLVAEMLAQLGRHRPLHKPLRQPLQQAVGAGDLLRRACAGEQLIDQLVR
jgi:hypothetical protein